MRGDGSIFLRGSTYWMKFYREGRPISISCGTSSKDIAKTKLRAELRKSDEEFTEPRFKRVTVGELVAALAENLEARGKGYYAGHVRAGWKNHLAAHFDGMKAVKLDSESQHKYRKFRMGEGAAAATINLEIQALASAFRLGYAMEPPLVKRMPKFHLVRVNNARRVFATPAQLAAVKRESSNPANYEDNKKITILHMRAFIEIALWFGWRVSEVCTLRVSNVRVDDAVIRIEDSKNDDARECPMTPAIRALTDALIVGKSANDLLFPFSQVALRNQWIQITTAAGCPDLHIHDLRRTSARQKRAAGVDTSVIMEMHGWRTEGMFRRYGIVAKDDKIAALDKQMRYEDEQLQNGYNKGLSN